MFGYQGKTYEYCEVDDIFDDDVCFLMYTEGSDEPEELKIPVGEMVNDADEIPDDIPDAMCDAYCAYVNA